MTTKSTSKSPGFWFYTGDWLKDPELRFCSIFARGLLVDLLCLMFESSERGYLSKPDGTARTDDQIVDAIAGGERTEKLAALAELESSGVLSRDNRGVLYSRRMARLGELSASRAAAGAKGGTKSQAKAEAKPQANTQAKLKQNRGVSDSVSASVSDSKYTHSHTSATALKIATPPTPDPHPDPSPVDDRSPDPVDLPSPPPDPHPAWAGDWGRWVDSWEGRTGRRFDPILAEVQMGQLFARDPAKAATDLRFSLEKYAKTILDSGHRFDIPSPRSGSGRHQPERRKRVGI